MQGIAPLNSLRAQGRPGTGRHPWSACSKKRTRQNHRLSQEYPAFPARVVLTLIRDLLGDRRSCPRRLTVHLPQGLASAPGCQDHTTSRACIIVRPRKKSRCSNARPSHPASNVRDDRDTPLMWRRDVRKDRSDLPDETSDAPCDKVTRRAIRGWLHVQIARRQDGVANYAAVSQNGI